MIQQEINVSLELLPWATSIFLVEQILTTPSQLGNKLLYLIELILRIKKYDWSREVTWREDKSSFPSRCHVSLSCRMALRCGCQGHDIIVQLLCAKSHSLTMKGQSMQHFHLMHVSSILSSLSAVGIINN